jgi:hypothetical protein
MKKALLFILSVFNLNLIMAHNSMLAMTQNLNSSDQYLTNQTLTKTTVWYSFQTATSGKAGVYFYTLEYTNALGEQKILNGYITLLR